MGGAGDVSERRSEEEWEYLATAASGVERERRVGGREALSALKATTVEKRP